MESRTTPPNPGRSGERPTAGLLPQQRDGIERHKERTTVSEKRVKGQTGTEVSASMDSAIENG